MRNARRMEMDGQGVENNTSSLSIEIQNLIASLSESRKLIYQPLLVRCRVTSFISLFYLIFFSHPRFSQQFTDRFSRYLNFENKIFFYLIFFKTIFTKRNQNREKKVVGNDLKLTRTSSWSSPFNYE